MNPVIEKLRGYGHQNNPMIRAAFVNLTEGDWDRMTPESELGHLLIQSFQMMMPEHEALCLKHHGRSAQFDGELGKATDELLTVERCGCEDYQSPETLEATGRGGFPVGCHPDYPGFHVTYMYCDLSGANANQRAWFDDIFAMFQEANREIGHLVLRTDDRSKAHEVLTFESLGGSTIGLALVGFNHTCNRQWWLKIDRNYSPSAVQVCKVLAHEKAHNDGVGHINGDPIQNASVNTRDWNGSFKGTPLGNIYVVKYGGEPVPRIDEPPPDDPKPPTSGGKIAIRGKLQIENYGDKPIVIQPGAKYEDSFIVIPE